MTRCLDLESRLLHEIAQVKAIDVHSHVPAQEPFARSLRDLLGYHYYTELAHSAGTPKEVLAPDEPDEQAIPALLRGLEAAHSTVQYSWLVELSRELFGFSLPAGGLTAGNWRPLDEAVRKAAARPGRARELMELSRIKKVFLTNSFDEPLDGIDRQLFVPSLRADPLVFTLADVEAREALERASSICVRDGKSLRDALAAVLERFVRAGACSVAISLPPGFHAAALSDQELNSCLKGGRRTSARQAGALPGGVLLVLAGLCQDFGLPMQVMYGAIRNAYEHGVLQGRDLPQAGDTLSGLLPLFNGFPGLTFCLSVLSESQAQELTSYGWMLHNVVPSGHWWYANVPAYIERDLAARLQSVPATKLIGYYSDMYKLEFGLPKFGMYRRILARVLAEEFVEPGFGSEEDALAIARLLLRDNAARIFRLGD